MTQRIHPGKEAAFEALLREVEANTIALDDGCLRYEWYKSEEPQTYILIERWRDREAASVHLKAPHTQAVLARMRDCVPAPFTIRRLTRLA